MNTHVVLDTSVVIKWFRQGEILADRALALRTAYLHGDVQIAVPALLAYEITNVLRYKQDLTTDQVGDAVQSLFDMGLTWVAPTAALMRRSAELAREHNVTAYDAAFAVVAEGLAAIFITADERLARSLAGFSPARHLDEVQTGTRDLI